MHYVRQIETFHFELSNSGSGMNQFRKSSRITNTNSRTRVDTEQKEQEIMKCLHSLRNYLSQNYIASQNIILNKEKRLRKGAIRRYRECNTSLSFVLEYSENAPMKTKPEFFTTMMRPKTERKVENDRHTVFPFLLDDHLQLYSLDESVITGKSETSPVSSDNQKRSKRSKRNRDIKDQNTNDLDKFKDAWALGTFQTVQYNVNVFCQSIVDGFDEKNNRATNLSQYNLEIEKQTKENNIKSRIKKSSDVDEKDDPCNQFQRHNDEENYTILDTQRYNCDAMQTNDFKKSSKIHDNSSSRQSPQAIFNPDLGYTGKQRLTFSDEKKKMGAIDSTKKRVRTPKGKSPGTLSEAPTLLVSECFSNKKHPSLWRHF